MEFKYFSRNGELLSIEQAVVPLSNIQYSYGFGVYESIHVANGAVYFLQDHLERLIMSARAIGLEHTFSTSFTAKSITELLEKNAADTCNVKILLIGGKTKDDAALNILCLNPLFPDKKSYRDGIAASTYTYERSFPHAKTLNMLESYLAYRKAKEAGAYDALLLDREGRITEGTRTNFFAIKDKTLLTPDESAILHGVMRKVVLHVAAQNGFALEQKDIRPEDLSRYDGALLTSTSSKILPVRSIDGHRFPGPSEATRELMRALESFLQNSGGNL